MENNQFKPSGDYHNRGLSKKATGVLCGIFVPFFIAIIIGCCCFNAGSYERQTFFKGFWLTFAVVWGALLVLGLIIGLAT